MKKTIIALMLALSVGCSATHSFMDNAYVGYVDNQAVVMFDAGTRNGVKYYRPQFQSDCGHAYNKTYQDDNSSTGCLIRESRINDLHPYNNHPDKVKSKYADNIIVPFESVKASINIPDDI